MPVDSLQLHVTEFTDQDHWRWSLTDSDGRLLADHQVDLDPSDIEYQGFIDLERYLGHYAAPDKWPEDETRLIEQIGAWIGQKLMGPIAARITDYGTSVTVRVILPPEAFGLLYRPLELAHAGGVPLALQDVSLVLEVDEEAAAARWQPVGDELRMLAVFSQPRDQYPLGLRRERYELKRLISRIRRTYNVAIELRVLQYGVTRDALQEILEEGKGWDVMHFSGHGKPAHLVLEKSDGTADVITAPQLEKLLWPARGRLKLVTLSSCQSAAPEILDWLGISHLAPMEPVGNVGNDGSPDEVSPASAQALVRNLGCAVLAMRYLVDDDFAISLCAAIYEGLFGKGQRLTRATQLAIPSALGEGPRPGVPPLSVAIPALFGERAANLELKPPVSTTTEFTAPTTSLADFPDEAERFVGRGGPMARASAVLAPQSGQTGVFFYGMAGAGKTSCAVELAHQHEKSRFGGFVWYKAPDQGNDISGALLSLALDMERQLPDFTMLHVVDQVEGFVNWLPRLTELLEQRSILIVIDNLESLLTSEGKWRDERWGHLIYALLHHQGGSRLVMTSRIRAADLGDDAVLHVEPIHALSLREAVLLASELPNLGRLLLGKAEVGLETGRNLVNRTIGVVQGHPKLIELAEGQANDPEALVGHLERVSEASKVGQAQVEAFFREGESTLDAADFLTVLTQWTRVVVASLSPEARVLFQFVCCLEGVDRRSSIIQVNWTDLWKRLERQGQVPTVEATLGLLVTAGLMDAQQVSDGFDCKVHPVVAESGRVEAGDVFQAAVDSQMTAAWEVVFKKGMREEMTGGGDLIVNVGLRVVPYLLRQRRWEVASKVLEQVVARDNSPRTLANVLPLIRRIISATGGTERELRERGKLGRVLMMVGRTPEAETILRDVIQEAVDRSQFRDASVASTVLIDLLKVTGRAKEALPLAEDMKEFTHRAGLGAWEQLSDERQRLDLLNEVGCYEEVLSAVEGVRARMGSLPEQGQQESFVPPWNVREGIFNAGREAALHMKRDEVALALNAESLAIKEARGAPALDLSNARFNDYGPLLRLKRYGEAHKLLHFCRDVFQEEDAIPELGNVFSALAQLESHLGNYPEAIAFEETSLRYTYTAGRPRGCAISHQHMALHLMLAGEDLNATFAHLMACGVIELQIGGGLLVPTFNFLRKKLGPEPPPLPGTFHELCDIVEQVEGVRFRELFERLPRDRAATGDDALAAAIEMLREDNHGERPSGK